MSEFSQRLQAIIDQKTKPTGSLGRLESLALQIASVQGTERPALRQPTVLVFAADHGAARAGVSAYPQAVTAQMVRNFLAGGAAINVFCRDNRLALRVVDAGLAEALPASPELIDARVAPGTRNYLEEPAMSPAQLEDCFGRAEALVEQLCAAGCNTLGFGEMGIGNTASASLLMSAVCGLPLTACVGPGAGADRDQLARKLELLGRAQARHGVELGPRELLQTYGGFEVAQMAAAMLAARRRGCVLVIDGFISTAAYLIARCLEPDLAAHAVFSHRSGERGHAAMLDYLGARPLLDLGLRLGEGTGCALAMPLLRAAVGFLNDMASFADAGVSGPR